MKIGIVVNASSATMEPTGLARAVEERGFESLWVPDHSHVPLTTYEVVNKRASIGNEYATAKTFGDRYANLFEPFVWLAYAAASTTKLLLGTSVCVVAQRDPLYTAKSVASLDLLSKGRFIFGVGYGWNDLELSHHRVRAEDRIRAFREKLAAMKALWTKEPASFSGRLVDFPPSVQLPRPLQRPYPPVFLGANPRPSGATAGDDWITDLIETCDGWLPFFPRFTPETLQLVKQLAEAAGRSPSSIRLSMHRAPANPRSLESLALLGFERATISVPSADAETMLPILDDLQRVAATFSNMSA
jgi:probable F420-dependent oxidoreductase